MFQKSMLSTLLVWFHPCDVCLAFVKSSTEQVLYASDVVPMAMR